MSAKKGFDTRHIDIKAEHIAIIALSDKSYSHHVEEALDLYFKYKFSVYKITEKATGKFYIWFYNYSDEPHDEFWHLVNTRGNNSLGHDIRDIGPEYFIFEVITRCNDEKRAKLISKLLTSVYRKKYDYWEF
jgi:hypothetical protein